MADGAPGRTIDAGFAPELLIWLSPAFPTGAFAFSHGLERLVEARVVRDRATLVDWLRDLASLGGLRNDCVLLAAAWRAAAKADAAMLEDVAELAAALAPSAERQLETLTQGRAFAAAIAAAWSCPSLARLLERGDGAIAYPLAVGAATADRAIELGDVLRAYVVAFATSLVSAAIRLSVIGQFDGQRVLAEILDDLRSLAAWAETTSLDDLGGAMLLSDIASMEHETQYTRLFRS